MRPTIKHSIVWRLRSEEAYNEVSCISSIVARWWSECPWQTSSTYLTSTSENVQNVLLVQKDNKFASSRNHLSVCFSATASRIRPRNPHRRVRVLHKTMSNANDTMAKVTLSPLAERVYNHLLLNEDTTVRMTEDTVKRLKELASM